MNLSSSFTYKNRIMARISQFTDYWIKIITSLASDIINRWRCMCTTLSDLSIFKYKQIWTLLLEYASYIAGSISLWILSLSRSIPQFNSSINLKKYYCGILTGITQFNFSRSSLLLSRKFARLSITKVLYRNPDQVSVNNKKQGIVPGENRPMNYLLEHTHISVCLPGHFSVINTLSKNRIIHHIHPQQWSHAADWNKIETRKIANAFLKLQAENK